MMQISDEEIERLYNRNNESKHFTLEEYGKLVRYYIAHEKELKNRGLIFYSFIEQKIKEKGGY